MVFKIDFIDGRTVSWKKGETGVEAERHSSYHPRFYIEGSKSKLHRSRSWLTRQDGVVATKFEAWKPTLKQPEKQVLRVDCSTEDALRTAVNRLKKGFGRSTFRFYNVGFSPQFRFCLQRNKCPVPETELEKVEIELSRKKLSNRNISGIRVDNQRLQGGEKQVLEEIRSIWRQKDPDLVIASNGQVLSLLNNKIQEHQPGFSLGRMERFQQLAGGNTVSSYGKRQHKSARFNIPGRIIIDRSNSFMLGETTLEGLWDLVERSYRPMQELAWGSIGRLLTSIEVRKAYLEEGTLTPWKNWGGEKPKKASTMHKADRGGFIFSPDPGVYRDVYEADFASLFPNIMVEKNISPETVCCNCCNNSRTPELGYSICEEKDGFIGKVLQPLIEHRQQMKEELGNIEDESRRRYVEGSIDAIKWILVSCFGYMGHSHASYGAIRCHQAIQAFDRDIMLKAKESFEESGYSVTHGIIDSIWVQEDNPTEEFEEVCRQVSDDVGIELEPEYRFDWCAFVPRKSSRADISTLNRYFGKKKNGDLKTAGIEAEQDPVSNFIKDAQIKMIEALDEEMSEDDVIEVVKKHVTKLESNNVPVDSLVKTKKTSKNLDDYKVENRTVSALRRAKKHNKDVRPGEEVKFVVKNDSAKPLDRTRLEFESSEGDYDPNYYSDMLIRAAESVTSPLGVEEDEIRSRVFGRDTKLTQYRQM